MELIISLFEAANKLSPLAIIGLLVGLVYIALTQHRTAIVQSGEIQSHFDTLRHNDLHTLTEMSETLRRLEVSQAENFSAILTELRRR